MHCENGMYDPSTETLLQRVSRSLNDALCSDNTVRLLNGALHKHSGAWLGLSTVHELEQLRLEADRRRHQYMMDAVMSWRRLALKWRETRDSQTLEERAELDLRLLRGARWVAHVRASLVPVGPDVTE